MADTAVAKDFSGHLKGKKDVCKAAALQTEVIFKGIHEFSVVSRNMQRVTEN